MADAIVAMMPNVHPGILFSVAVVVVAICRYLVRCVGGHAAIDLEQRVCPQPLLTAVDRLCGWLACATQWHGRQDTGRSPESARRGWRRRR